MATQCAATGKKFGMLRAHGYRQSKLCDYNCFDFVVADPWSANIRRVKGTQIQFGAKVK